MKNTIKKISKFIVSRALYFVLGICVAIVISAVYAAVSWPAPLPTVSSGDPLTSSAWNNLIDSTNDLNTRITTLEGSAGWPAGSYCIMKNGACPAGFVPRSLGLYVGAHAHDMCAVGNRSAGDSVCSGGSPMATLTISACCK